MTEAKHGYRNVAVRVRADGFLFWPTVWEIGEHWTGKCLRGLRRVDWGEVSVVLTTTFTAARNRAATTAVSVGVVQNAELKHRV